MLWIQILFLRDSQWSHYFPFFNSSSTHISTKARLQGTSKISALKEEKGGFYVASAVPQGKCPQICLTASQLAFLSPPMPESEFHTQLVEAIFRAVVRAQVFHSPLQHHVSSGGEASDLQSYSLTIPVLSLTSHSSQQLLLSHCNNTL